MSYTPPLHIAVVRRGRLVGDKEVAFWAEACRLQLIDAARVWGLPAPGVAVYDANITIADGWAGAGSLVGRIDIIDDDGEDESAGAHTELGGMPFGWVDLRQASNPSRTLSHESLELFANAHLDRWAPGPNGLQYAVELCDPVQRSDYGVEVEIMGERRPVWLSDYVCPAWFGMPNGDGSPLVCFGGGLEPFELDEGGYAITKDRNGEVRYLSHRGGAFMEPRKLGPHSRMARLIAGGAR